MPGRIVSCLIGYIFGNFLSSVFIAGAVSKKSPFDYGSGNPGMANVTANLGRSLGIAVLLGDLLKTAAACALSWELFGDSDGRIVILYAGLGTTLGHNYPFWHKFKGGKGVASTCAAITLYSTFWGLASCTLGLAAVLITGYLPLGGIIIPAVYIIPAFLVFGREAGIISVILAILMCLRHRHGMARVFRHEEKKVKLIGKK